MQTKVLFARIGWMTYYAGPQPNDPRPLGGGAYNEQHRGNELFNFKKIKEHSAGEVLYGFVSPPEIGGNRLNLGRIAPTCKSDVLAGVTVIFIAHQKIIGWYRNATALRAWKNDPTREREWDERGRTLPADYNMKATARDAVLLPMECRNHQIPRGKNGFGQANVRYAYDPSLKPDLRKWMLKAIKYVKEYDGENLLTNPAADVGAQVAEALEKSAGHESDPAIRSAVEDHAMKQVERYYGRLGYFVRNTSKRNSYDFLCEKAGKKVYVEVKGTQTLGEAISLMHNEVTVACDAGKRVDLCVVHSIKLGQRKKPKAKGGVLVNYPNWNPEEHDLKPVHYICKLNQPAKAPGHKARGISGRT